MEYTVLLVYIFPVFLSTEDALNLVTCIHLPMHFLHVLWMYCYPSDAAQLAMKKMFEIKAAKRNMFYIWISILLLLSLRVTVKGFLNARVQGLSACDCEMVNVTSKENCLLLDLCNGCYFLYCDFYGHIWILSLAESQLFQSACVQIL